MALGTNASFIDLGMARMGTRVDATIRAALVTEMEATQYELEHGEFLPWFLETVSGWSLVQGDSSKPLPEGFLREVEEAQPFVLYDGIETPLWKYRMEDFRALYPDSTLQGIPASYAIDGTTIYFGPVVSEACTISIKYYKKADVTQDNTTAATNAWLLTDPNVLLYTAAARVAGFHLSNEKLSDRLEGAALRAKIALMKAHEARIHTNMDYSDLDKTVGLD